MEQGRSVNLSLAKRAIKAFEIIGAKDRILEKTIKMYGRTSHVDGETHYI
jgi:hypothetical protein